MALTTLVNFWWTPFLLRHFSQKDFGLWTTGVPIITYVGLLDFGVISVLQRDVAFALGAAGGDFRKAAELPTLVGKTQRLVLAQLPILCLVALVSWRMLPTTWGALRGPMLVILTTIALCFPLRVNHALLMGLQDLSFVAKVNFANWAICIGGGAILVLAGWGLYALAGSFAAGQFLTAIAFWLRVRQRFPGILSGRLPPLARGEALERLGKGFWIIVSQLAGILLNGGDVIVIAAVLGPAAVVPYAVTDKLIALLANVPQHLMVTTQPALSELRSGAERKRLAEVCIALMQAVLVVAGFVAAIAIAVDQGFVAWWVGPLQFAGNRVVFLLTAGMVLNQWWISTTYATFSFGYERRIAITTVMNGLLTLGLTVALTRAWGVVGAAAAPIFGFLAVALPANLFAIGQETGRPARRLVASILPWAIRFLVLAAAIGVGTRFWIPRTVLQFAATSVGVALAYGALMMAIVLREPLGTYARPRLATLRARLSWQRG
jgi:O-antigen/teichoic acid export membrane protein